MMRKFGFVVVAAFVGTAWAENGDEGLVREKDYNAWHFRIGPVMSPRVRVNVRGPRFALPAMPKRQRRPTRPRDTKTGNTPMGTSILTVERRTRIRLSRESRGSGGRITFPRSIRMGAWSSIPR